ncbi:hypothetical protein [Actinoallomurus sp. CA-142502]|uniref:hypothetical protein n=1 Tax=Actinoallomurus sp. CA-142502 TaxID=3239885 RepID=UPI003D8BA527
MRTFAPAVTRAAAAGTALAAVGVLVFTAVVNAQSGSRSPRPVATHPVTPVPVSTLPGSVDSPGATPTVPARQTRAWLRALTGTWTRNVKNTYFRFHTDGSGEWVAFGQKLWTGKATPRDAKTFDLTDTDGHGGSYWQVRLLSRDRLLFAGTNQTFTRS